MHRKAFAISSFLLLVMLGAIMLNNYNREWKQYQRQYFYELDERDAAGESLGQTQSLLDQLASTANDALNVLNTESKLGMVKVVTEPGRSADMCMTCHINAGVSGFEEQPLIDLFSVHPEYITQNYPFDQYGCTACHGGKPLALSVEKAHEGLTDTVEAFFLLKVAELSAPNWIIRQKAIERIRWVTGDDFGYAQDGSPEEIQAAVERILDWWQMHRQTFFAEGFGERDSPFKTENPIAKVIEADTQLSPTGQPLEYVNNNSCIACHTSFYSQRLQAAVDEDNQDAIQAIGKQLDHIRLWADIDLGDITLSDEAFDKIAKDYTCQACHGPGQEYVTLMQKGYALLMQGKSIESSDILKRASEIGRGNARRNLSDPKVWELLQLLAAQSDAVVASARPEAQPERPGTEMANEPETEAPPEVKDEPEVTEPGSPQGQPPAQSDETVLIETGKQLAASCMGCHTVDGATSVGPTWQGLFGKTETLDDDNTVVVDEAYLKESIQEPGAKVVKGFGNFMPPYASLSDEEVAALIAYIRSLAP